MSDWKGSMVFKRRRENLLSRVVNRGGVCGGTVGRLRPRIIKNKVKELNK